LSYFKYLQSTCLIVNIVVLDKKYIHGILHRESLLRVLAYANDVVLVYESQGKFKDIFNKLERTTAKVGFSGATRKFSWSGGVQPNKPPLY